ncbi:MAG TPA: molybdopterin molybdotransferase MoeA [Sphingomicrobium sp.]
MTSMNSQPEGQIPCSATLSFDDAQAILMEAATPLGTERVLISKAGRRVLAEPVIAAFDSPRRDTAALDGVAVCERDLASGRRRFRLIGASYPGAPFGGNALSGTAVRIMTGGALPAGAGRVVPLELLTEQGEHVVLPASLPTRMHVRHRGADFATGAAVLAAGRVIDPRALVVAAAADAAELIMWRRPRVYVIATGDELVAPGNAADLDEGVPDSLSEALQLMVRQWGGQPIGATRTCDDANAVSAAAEAALEKCDVLVMAGGASRGDRDLARSSLARVGLKTCFAGVAMKPGKPVWYGRLGARHVLGLPGNPTAAMTTARLFLVPLLTALGGRGFRAGLDWQSRPIAGSAEETGPRESFLCGANVEGGVEIIGRQTASAQGMLASADLLVRRLPNSPSLHQGDQVQALRF